WPTRPRAGKAGAWRSANAAGSTLASAPPRVRPSSATPRGASWSKLIRPVSRQRLTVTRSAHATREAGPGQLGEGIAPGARARHSVEPGLVLPGPSLAAGGEGLVEPARRPRPTRQATTLEPDGQVGGRPPVDRRPSGEPGP